MLLLGLATHLRVAFRFLLNYWFILCWRFHFYDQVLGVGAFACLFGATVPYV